MMDVTHILQEIGEGDAQAAEKLLPLVYNELRKLAASKLAQEQPGQTLQATALVHEAFLRLLPQQHGSQDDVNWDDRGHFFSAAAEAMRRILIENARRKAAVKHGGEFQRVVLTEADAVDSVPDSKLLELNDAIDELKKFAPVKAKLVLLRYFAGLTEEQAANSLGISRPTAARWWAFSKAWLYERMSSEP